MEQKTIQDNFNMRVASYTPGEIGVLEIELPREDLVDMYQIATQYERIDPDMLDLTTDSGSSFNNYMAGKVVKTLKDAVEKSPTEENVTKLNMYEDYIPILGQILSCAAASVESIKKSDGNSFEIERIDHLSSEISLIRTGLASEEVIQGVEQLNGYSVPRFK